MWPCCSVVECTWSRAAQTETNKPNGSSVPMWRLILPSVPLENENIKAAAAVASLLPLPPSVNMQNRISETPVLRRGKEEEEEEGS